jgi:uncharacterized heparinase superfamily protein
MTRPALPTLLRTLWYLRPEQLVGEARRRLLRFDRPLRRAEATPVLRIAAPPAPWLPPPRRERPPAQRLWNDAGAGRLAEDTLHRFAWLRAPELRPAERLAVLLDWIARHPRGVGWQPVNTSRRVLAWLQCLTTPGALPPPLQTHGRVLPSLADQLATLDARLETDRLGSRLLWNLLALVGAGVLLEGAESARWLAHAPRLARELEAQIGPDGAHQERSPMLHAELLGGVLDLLNASRAAPGRAPAGLEDVLAEKAAAMLGAHAVWTHPDGEIALLGDSALGAAQPLAELAAYAKALGVAPRAPARPGVLHAAGVVKLEAGPLALIFTAAPPAPAWQPGHAHCDALSFELSVAGERVVADTGVCDFAEGPRRDLARATRSHATVVVNDAEQAELWGADRIGGRPDVGLVRVDPGALVEGVCAGWATPEVLHRRQLRIENGALTIEDRFDRPAARARLALPLAPGVAPRLDGASATLALPSGRRLALGLPPNARWRVERAPCFVELGGEVERAVLVGEARGLAAADWRVETRRGAS